MKNIKDIKTAPNNIDWEKKLKGKKCQLCRKATKEKLHFMVGGCITYAHESCMSIIKRYRRLLITWEKQIHGYSNKSFKDKNGRIVRRIKWW